MSAMTMERPGVVRNEWNHSCSPGACGNCGNPSGSLVQPVITPETEPFPAPAPVTPVR